jgi:hypothetical protein
MPSTPLAVITSPVLGLKLNQPSVSIPIRAATKAKNVRYFRGQVRQRPGGLAFLGTTTDDHMGYFTARFDSGNEYSILLTLDDFVRISSGAWSVVAANVFTGTTNDYFAAKVINNKFYCTQGVDDLRSWADGAGSTVDVTGAPGGRAIEDFADRCVLGHIRDSGTTYPQRVQWSVSGDPDTWTGTGSGATDLLISPGGIMNMLRVRSEQLVIYKDDSIVIGTRTGVATEPIAFNQKAVAMGIPGFRCVTAAKNRHYFLGSDFNAYEFTGVEPVAIGDDVVREIQAMVDPAQSRHFVVRANPVLAEVYFGIIRPGSTIIDFVWVYNWEEQAWSTWENVTFRAFDVIKRSASKSWAQMSGTWDSQVSVWDIHTTLAQAPQTLLGKSTQAYELDEDETVDDTSLTNDAETAIDWDFQLGDSDFEMPGRNKTVIRVGVQYQNLGVVTSLNVELSTNEGNSWAAETLSIGSTSNSGEILWAWGGFVTTGANLRVRLRNNTASQAVVVHQVLVEGEESGVAF